MDSKKYYSFILILITLLAVNFFYFTYFSPTLIFAIICISIDAFALILWLVFLNSTKKIKINKNVNFAELGLTPEMVETFLTGSHEKLESLLKYKDLVKNDKIKHTIQEIIVVLKKILNDIEKDPANIKRTRRFLSYYLETTLKIITKYYELSKEEIVSDDLKKSLVKVESTLDSLKNTFVSYYKKLLDDDAMDLDAEIEVLEKTIKMENY